MHTCPNQKKPTMIKKLHKPKASEESAKHMPENNTNTSTNH